jgi:hypothetical protein
MEPTSVDAASITPAPEPAKPAKHKAKNKSGMHVCSICQKVYSAASSLRDHGNAHTDRFKCSRCGKRKCAPSFLVLHAREPASDFVGHASRAKLEEHEGTRACRAAAAAQQDSVMK